ncbi:anoctamin-6-like isoform X3 [Camelus ferus]|uniref:Anoctamin-6-like isoform X3 n=1 Tax=Camelus ferus TaxID=419612 RepID=A0A8B8SK57_CAMFR|nr:anoctamin-6-like isoform X3 [Camelus ferus]XP_032330135.1 anoctamin-6-like isoform X3 [Camelus ferus]
MATNPWGQPQAFWSAKGIPCEESSTHRNPTSPCQPEHLHCYCAVLSKCLFIRFKLRKHEPMNLTSSVMVCSWEQPDQCQSLCSHWLGACMFPGMIFEICHPSRAFAVGWEYRFWMTSLYAKVHTLWEVLCTYAEILHIKLPLKSNDLKTRSSAFDNFSCFMKVLQVDESIIKPEQEFFIALFEKSCVNDFYIQDRDTFFNPATRSRIEEERVPFTTWGKCIHITLCASAFFWCDPGGCLLELMKQLTIIMGGQSIWNNIQEVLLPSKRIYVVLPSIHHSMLCVHSFNRYSVWVHHSICGLFPVAPLLALENNILEIRVGTWNLDYPV